MPINYLFDLIGKVVEPGRIELPTSTMPSLERQE